MLSAFGVDHGEVNKALFPGHARKQALGMVRTAQKQARANRRNAAFGRLKRLPNEVGNAEISINRVGRGIGQGVSDVGRGFANVTAKHPTATGVAVVGAGGYALHASGRKRKENMP
jgi:hypothetical protein